MVPNHVGRSSMLMSPVNRSSMVTTPLGRLSIVTSPVDRSSMLEKSFKYIIVVFAVRNFPQELTYWNTWFLMSSAIFKVSQPCCMKYITGYGFWQFIYSLASNTVHSLCSCLTLKMVYISASCSSWVSYLPVIKDSIISRTRR